MTIHHCVFGSAGSPTNLYFAKQSKTLLGQEECAFAFCSYNNKLEHQTSSLKSSCRRLQFSQQSFPSFLICKVPQLSVLNKPVGLGQSVCVCVCVCIASSVRSASPTQCWVGIQNWHPNPHFGIYLCNYYGS